MHDAEFWCWSRMAQLLADRGALLSANHPLSTDHFAVSVKWAMMCSANIETKMWKGESMKLTSEVYIRLAENEPAFICTILGVSIEFPITFKPEILPHNEDEPGMLVRLRRTSKASLHDEA